MSDWELYGPLEKQMGFQVPKEWFPFQNLSYCFTILNY